MASESGRGGGGLLRTATLLRHDLAFVQGAVSSRSLATLAVKALWTEPGRGGEQSSEEIGWSVFEQAALRSGSAASDEPCLSRPSEASGGEARMVQALYKQHAEQPGALFPSLGGDADRVASCNQASDPGGVEASAGSWSRPAQTTD